jgi:hypothetical protein
MLPSTERSTASLIAGSQVTESLFDDRRTREASMSESTAAFILWQALRSATGTQISSERVSYPTMERNGSLNASCKPGKLSFGPLYILQSCHSRAPPVDTKTAADTYLSCGFRLRKKSYGTSIGSNITTRYIRALALELIVLNCFLTAAVVDS